MLIELVFPAGMAQVSEEFLRESCGFDAVDNAALPLLPEALPPVEGRLRIGIMQVVADTPDEGRCTMAEMLAFFFTNQQLGSPWVTPAPEASRVRILVTGDSPRTDGLMPMVQIEKIDGIYRRTLTVLRVREGARRLGDWVFRTIR